MCRFETPSFVRCTACPFLAPAECTFGVIGLQDLAARVLRRLSSVKKVKKYSSRNWLRRDMWSLDPAYEVFVSGPKCGSGKYFFCRICERDVGIRAHGSGEFAQHFQSDGHWHRDVTYRVHMGLPLLNRLMEPMTLLANQLSDYSSRVFVDLAEDYPFPEELVPKQAKVASRVPFMTLVSRFCDLLQRRCLCATMAFVGAFLFSFGNSGTSVYFGMEPLRDRG